MRIDHLLAHLEATSMTRRELLRVAGAAGAAAVAGTVAGELLDAPYAHGAAAPSDPEPLTDDMFDVAAVERGAWAPGPYGPGDQRGSFNEVTPESTARVLRMLDARKPVFTYNLGDELFNGYPAFTIAPPRIYEQRLTVLGYPPKAGFTGILQAPVPLGPNRISAHEERFPLGGTYQIATQLDNLAHVGVGEMFYNGFKGPDIAEGYGTNKLGNEHMGPIVARGIVADVLGLKQAQGETKAFFTTPKGAKVLHDNYRITIDDIEAALARAGSLEIEPGDVVLLRTGWGALVREDPQRYLAREPGIYLREARWIGPRRPAIVGGDSWALELLDPAVIGQNLFPVHQMLLMRWGIRIGEGMLTDRLVGDGVFEFVFIVTPQFATGATAGNTPPCALAQPKGEAAGANVPTAKFVGARGGRRLPPTGGDGRLAAGAAAAGAAMAARRSARKSRRGNE